MEELLRHLRLRTEVAEFRLAFEPGSRHTPPCQHRRRGLQVKLAMAEAAAEGAQGALPVEARAMEASADALRQEARSLLTLSGAPAGCTPWSLLPDSLGSFLIVGAASLKLQAYRGRLVGLQNPGLPM